MLMDAGLAHQKKPPANNLWADPAKTAGAGQGQGGAGQPGADKGAVQNEVKVGQDQAGGAGQQAAKALVQGSPQDKSPPPRYPSREELIGEVQQNPTKFNVPPGMPADQFAQQYFNEFVAKLAGKQPYAMDAKGNPLPYDDKQAGKVWTPQEKDMLAKWGYNPEVPKGNIADDNSKSGLYALRIEPAKGSSAPPIVAFRGTEPADGPQDLQSDLGGKYVGQSQYEGNRQMIENRLSRPGDKNVDVVGYSLGGALAQKYTADHAAQVGQLSTFQAPGIDQADADKFKKANADGHVNVNHFYNDADIVHRAGAAKLDGSFHQVVNPAFTLKDKLTLHPHLSSIICNSNDDFEGAVGQQNIHNYDKDPQKDRPYLEGARRLLGPAASSFLGGAYAPAVAGIGDVKTGIGDAKKGLGEVKQGAGDLLHHPLTGLGEMGHGVLDTLKGAKEGFGGAKEIVGGLKTGLGAAGNTLMQGGANLLHKGFDGAKSLAGNAAHAIGNGASNLANAAGNKIMGAEHAVVNGATNLAQAAGNKIVGAEHAVVNGATNLAHAAGDKIVGAEHAIANTASNVKNAAGSAISNTGHAIANTASNVKNAAGSAISNTGHAISNGFDAAKHFFHL